MNTLESKGCDADLCSQDHMFCGINTKLVKILEDTRIQSFSFVDKNLIISDEISVIEKKLHLFLGDKVFIDYSLQKHPQVIISTIKILFKKYEEEISGIFIGKSFDDLAFLVKAIGVIKIDLIDDSFKKYILSNISAYELQKISKLFRDILDDMRLICTGGNDLYANIISNIIMRIDFYILDEL